MGVNVNIYEELSHKYNKELKQQLKSNYLRIIIVIECIMTKNQSISFDDIAGNEYAKEIINETFILPEIAPNIFKGNVRPWQSILLYGVKLI